MISNILKILKKIRKVENFKALRAPENLAIST
jgi:hypothetical protein